MKNFTVIILFLFSSFLSYTQDYVPFPESNAVWQEVIKPYPPGPMPSYMEHNHYSVSGDTLINNTSYIKLYKTQYDVNCSQFYEGPFFYGGLRNDLIERKVYFYYAEYGEEYLLYDFSLDVGDTVPNTYNNYSFPDLIVESIDSILVGDQFRKRFFYVEPFMEPLQVIEGMGAETGLLEPMFQFEVIHYIRCFHQNDSLYWMNTTYCLTCNLETDTCLAISVPETNMDKGFLEIYPNPAKELIMIHYKYPGSNQYIDIRVEVYDVYGEKVGESFMPGSKDEFIYDVSGLTNGLYILIINQGLKKHLTKKLLIAK